MIYQQGIYDIDIEDYHASEGISRSGVMLFKKSPLHYWNAYKNPLRAEKKDSTPQQILGSIFHTLILEPNNFDNTYILKPEPIKIGKQPLLRDVGRDEYELAKKKIESLRKAQEEADEDFIKKSEGKIIVNEETYKIAKKMVESFMSHKQASQFLDKAKIEKSIFWHDSHSGVLCKARPDIWHTNMIVDIKTTTDASPQAFQRSIAQYGYHIQAAMIQDGIHHIEKNRITDYVFIAIESVEPYAIGIYILDQESINRGHDEYKHILKDYREYDQTSIEVWPGYKPNTISLPAYYI